MTKSNNWADHLRISAFDKQEKKETLQDGVTDEKINQRRFRANKPYFPRSYYFNTEASRDGIRHFVHGLGDDNPLFTDETYAASTKYGGIVAPGCYLYTIQWVPPGAMMPGVHAWYAGGEWEWYRPIFSGDQFQSICIIRELVEKKGRMTGGREIFIDYTDVVYINQKNEIVGKELQHTVLAGRNESKSAGKYRDLSKPVYIKKDWINILDQYADEEQKGKATRYWEDVNIGDKLPPMIKGPLSVRDELAWIMGGGSPFFRAHKLQYQYEHRHPKALEYVDSEEADAPGDVPELVHVLNAFAKGIGVERIYDYGSQRMSWLCNFFTNWMGDDGFLWKMSGDLRAFNQAGDITTFEGRVANKYVRDGRSCVDIEAWAKNQRNEWSMPPNISTVILSSREHGPVEYPEPSSELVEEIKKARPLDEWIKKGLL
ncbi:MaoC family dehydratase N-terminal domain-containing protein [Thermodesulfobacteriota bacterium]